MQWLTEMHKSHAPESPACLPEVAAALRVQYHHFVSSGCNPFWSPILFPPTPELYQIRDENSGECSWVSRADFYLICSHWTHICWTVYCAQKAPALSGYVSHRKRGTLDCAGISHLLQTSACIAAFEPVRNSFYFGPRHSGRFHTHSSPKRTGWREEREAENLTIVSRDPQILFQDLLWSKCPVWPQIKVSPECPELFSRPPTVEEGVKAKFMSTFSNQQPSHPPDKCLYMGLYLLSSSIQRQSSYLSLHVASDLSRSFWSGMLMAHSTTKPASSYIHSFRCAAS